MDDPILYLSMLLGLGGVYVLISSFNDDDDDGNDDGEKYHNKLILIKGAWNLYIEYQKIFQLSPELKN